MSKATGGLNICGRFTPKILRRLAFGESIFICSFEITFKLVEIEYYPISCVHLFIELFAASQLERLFIAKSRKLALSFILIHCVVLEV